MSELYQLSVNEKIPDAELRPPMEQEELYEVADDIEAEPMFSNAEDARNAFVNKIWDQMQTYHRREPTHDLDMLYGCASASIDEFRVWWIPLEHPIAELLKNHYDESGEYAPEEIYRTDLGEFAVFNDLAVKHCIKSITTMCEESGKALQVLITDAEMEELEKQMERYDGGEDSEDDEEEYGEEEETVLEVLVDEEKKDI